jgi:hypothetical protein
MLAVWGPYRALLSLQIRNLSPASMPGGCHHIQVMEPAKNSLLTSIQLLNRPFVGESQSNKEEYEKKSL